MRYSEYTDTDKFLDELFAENAEFGWQCEKPCDGHNIANITVVKQEGEAEVTYIKSLVSELSEKLMEIVDSVDGLPDERDRGYTLTKEECISRLISVSNSIDGILEEIKAANPSISGNSSVAIIGGGVPMGIPAMF